MVRTVSACALTVVGLVAVAPANATADPVAQPQPQTRAAAPAPPAAARGVGILDPQKSWEAAVAAAGAPADPSGASAAGTPAPMGALPTARLSAAAAATLAVTPDTNLVRGQSVAVTGTGFGAERIYVLECIAGEVLSYNCNSSGMLGVVPDAGGAISTTAAMHRIISGSTGPVDCATAPGTCELVAANRNAAVLARHALGFDPNAAPPTPAIAVTPATGLINGQAITIGGTGFFPNGFVYVRECAVSDGYCSGASAYLSADANGTFSAQLTARLRVGDGQGTTTHCLVVACIVRAESVDDLEYSADAPLAFDPNQPIPAPPQLTVTPSTGLTHEQSVVIAGTGFGSNSYVELSECASDTDRYCSEYLDAQGSSQADSTGSFSVTTTLTRLVGTYESGSALTITDCATSSCSVMARSYDDDDSAPLGARVPVTFDATPPLPAVPVVTVTPDSDLPYRAQVAVHGTGYRPGSSVYARYCAVPDAIYGCGYTGFYGEGTANDAGTVDFTMTVKRRVSGNRFGVPVDCVDRTAACFLLVQ
ncbi:MAG: neocarzinostatin apoprotein domain-containing protein, partial [Acidimicrobiia bacterium]